MSAVGKEIFLYGTLAETARRTANSILIPDVVKSPAGWRGAVRTRALVVADELGGASGGSTDWSDVELALELARTALGPEECAKIKADVYETEGVASDEDSDEDDED